MAGFDDSDFVLARYNTNGSPDTTFSGDGEQTTDFGGLRRRERVWACRRAARSSRSASPATDFALARYNPNGSLDTTFSGDGRQTTDFGGSDRANGVALKSTGRIIVAGGGGASGDFAIARYNPTGSLDTSFSGDGKQTTDFGGGGSARTPSRSKATGTSSRQETPSAPTEPGTSRSLATRGVEATFSAWRPA